MVSGRTHKLAISALCFAFGMVLPFLTSQIKEFGDSLLPMHIPIMVCGLVCGYKYGFAVGACLPFARAFCFGMPAIFPNAVWMSAELATYGLVMGYLYSKGQRNTRSLYIALVTAMICGRIVWGIAKAILLGIAQKPFSILMFFSGSVIDAMPGIALQFIIIPIIVKRIEWLIYRKNAG